MPRVRGLLQAIGVTNANETICATLPGIAVPAGNPVDFVGAIDLTTGATVTGVTLRIRRGTTITGATLIQFGPFAAAAATEVNFALAWVDTQAVEVNNQQYVLTVIQVAGTSVGTLNGGYLRADW